MLHERGIEWRNLNRYRAYPFRDDVDMSLSNGSKLPNDVIVDAAAVHYKGTSTAFSLIAIARNDNGDSTSTAVFTFQVGADTCTVSLPSTASVQLPVTVSPSGHRVSILFDEGALTLLDVGTSVTCDIPIQPALVIMHNRHRVATIAGTPPMSGLPDVSILKPVSGRVYARAGYNCIVEVIPGNDDTLPVLRIGAQYGAGEGVPCFPLSEDTETCREALLYINGMSGSSNGDFSIVGGEGVTVTAVPEEHKIVISGKQSYQNPGCANA